MRIQFGRAVKRRSPAFAVSYLQPEGGNNENRAVKGRGENGASQRHKAWSYM